MPANHHIHQRLLRNVHAGHEMPAVDQTERLFRERNKARSNILHYNGIDAITT